MGALTYTDLVEVDLGKLGTAVADWKTMVDDLSTLADDAESGLVRKADAARWKGLNAQVTRDFVHRTGKEFHDLHREARSIWNVLDDAHRELTRIQRDLRSMATELQPSSLGIRDNGDGTVEVVVARRPGEDGTATESQREAVREYTSRINRLIADATDVDASATLALNRAHGGDRYDAGHANYASLDDAQVDRALELAAIPPDTMTDRQMTEFNRLLKYNGTETNGAFATKFFQGLGSPREVLAFYGRMSVHGTGPEANGTRRDAVRELQRNLGFTLANATEPDRDSGFTGTKHHLPASWNTAFRALGTQTVELEPGAVRHPYGYQLLGGLLRYGTYDSRFLVPVAEHVTQLHQDENWRNTFAGGSTNLRDGVGFNPSGRLGTGHLPLNSVLEALGHSPDAAERFFTTEPTAYRDDGSVDPEGTAPDSYLDLFTKEDFPWGADVNNRALNDGTGFEHGPDALGHALEAATTGRSYESQATDVLPHSEAQAKLTADIVRTFGENPELIRRNMNGDLDVTNGPLNPLRDSLGNITADYMGDFQRNILGDVDAPPDTTSYPTAGEPVRFGDKSQLLRFLREVGQDPDAYASITHAQQAYTSRLVDNVINGDSDSTVQLSDRLENAVTPGSTVAGIMSYARADAILDYHAASDQEYNDAAAGKQKWVDRVLGLGIEGAGERVPIAGVALSWASEDLQTSIMNSIALDTTDEAEAEATRSYANGQEATADSAERATRSAIESGDHYYNDDTVRELVERVRQRASDSHNSGASWMSVGDAS